MEIWRELLIQISESESLTYDRYWDWTLDWEHPTAAPVFDANHGFGGDSSPDTGASREVIVGEDRCVVDGPFAGIVVHWYGAQDYPHCLSRGFHDKVEFDEIGHRFGPAAMEHALARDDYQSFLQELEDGPHLAIPQGIGGDFFYTVAPYGQKPAATEMRCANSVRSTLLPPSHSARPDMVEVAAGSSRKRKRVCRTQGTHVEGEGIVG